MRTTARCSVLALAAALAGCGDEDHINLTLVQAGAGALAAASQVTVEVQADDPNATPFAQTTFPVGGRTDPVAPVRPET